MNSDELLLQNNILNFNQSWHKNPCVKGFKFILMTDHEWAFKRMKKHPYRTNCHDFFSLSKHAGRVIAVYSNELFLRRVMWPMVLLISSLYRGLFQTHDNTVAHTNPKRWTSPTTRPISGTTYLLTPTQGLT